MKSWYNLHNLYINVLMFNYVCIIFVKLKKINFSYYYNKVTYYFIIVFEKKNVYLYSLPHYGRKRFNNLCTIIYLFIY